MSKENIGIGVRICPNNADGQSLQNQCVKVDNNCIFASNNLKVKQFEFQKVFDRYSDQESVFLHMALPLIEDMFKGLNTCLIVYGQNKSGKTYSICGKQSQESKGIIPRLIDHITCRLYKQPESIDKKNVLYLFRVSYIDIYEQQIIDLLTIRKGIECKIITNKQGQVFIKNLQIKSISKIADIESYLHIGNKKRQYAFSKNYRKPQKTTSIFTIYYQQLNLNKGQRILIGKMEIVDYQASHVMKFADLPLDLDNKSKNNYDLSNQSFKNVVQALLYSKKDTKIPYNDSKVTKILRQSLCGNSKTKILFHVIPSLKCYCATMQILRLAKQCQMIQNYPLQNIDQSSSICREYLSLRAQYKHIQKQIDQFQLTNYVDWAQRFKQDQNQFISQELLKKRFQEQFKDIIEEKSVIKQNLKKRVDFIWSLFVHLDKITQHQTIFYRDNYNKALSKLHKIQQQDMAFKNGMHNREKVELSSGNNIKHSEKQRKYRQQINDLKIENQQQKEMMLNAIRQLEKKFNFYQKIARKVMKKQEIEIIKMNSKYDQTKRSFELPLFAVRDKKIATASNYYSPNQRNLISSRSNSERNIFMQRFSSSKITNNNKRDSSHSNAFKISSHNQQSKDVNQFQENQYYESKIKKSKNEKGKKQQVFKMKTDDYEMIKSSYLENKFKPKTSKRYILPQRDSSSTQRKIKIIKPLISPRFKFK